MPTTLAFSPRAQGAVIAIKLAVATRLLRVVALVNCGWRALCVYAVYAEKLWTVCVGWCALVTWGLLEWVSG